MAVAPWRGVSSRASALSSDLTDPGMWVAGQPVLMGTRAGSTLAPGTWALALDLDLYQGFAAGHSAGYLLMPEKRPLLRSGLKQR